MLQTAQPYNPASGQFDGADYTLTAADGTVYDLSAAQTASWTRSCPAASALHFSGSGITSSTGDAVQLRPRRGRPDHDRSRRPTARASCTPTTRRQPGLGPQHRPGQSSRYGYARDDPHLLTLAAVARRPAPAPPSTTDRQPQVTPLGADLGGAGQFLHADYHGHARRRAPTDSSPSC